MKPIVDFCSKLKTMLSLDPADVVKKGERYFFLSKHLERYARENFFYAGIYLGKTKKGKFFPSFSLLALLAENEANRVIVDKKAAWLFICGRDVYKERILSVSGSRRKGDYTLVLNEFGECLGFGRIIRNLDVKDDGLAVKNISDIGDFLRREG